MGNLIGLRLPTTHLGKIKQMEAVLHALVHCKGKPRFRLGIAAHKRSVFDAGFNNVRDALA